MLVPMSPPFPRRLRFWPFACFNPLLFVARLPPCYLERAQETTSLFEIYLASRDRIGADSPLHVRVSVIPELRLAAGRRKSRWRQCVSPRSRHRSTFVILSGGIDLSVGAAVAFTSILIASLVGSGINPFIVIVIALLIGAIFGTAMGCLIQWFELPPFLVTLAGMFLARGMGFVVHPQSLGIEHPFFLKHITEDLSIHLTERVSVPFTATCFVVILLAALLVAHYTPFGRYIYALGGDEQSATLMGLPIGRTKIFTYTVSGFCSALAGVVYTFYTQSGDPASCVGLELDAIAAVVIGGRLLSGGVGFMAGTAMGVLILGLIQTLITFQGNLNTWWTRIVVGILVLSSFSCKTSSPQHPANSARRSADPPEQLLETTLNSFKVRRPDRQA
jgi:galactofuranose transport system permease protein